MDKWNQELIDVITRSRKVSNKGSKAASMQSAEMITICKKEYMDLKDKKCANIIHQTIRQSKAASISDNKNINQAQIIHNFLFNRH